MWYHPFVQALCADQSAEADCQPHRATIRRISNEGLTPGNVALLDELLAADYIVHSPFGDLNREGVKSFFGTLHGALTNFRVIGDQILVEGDFAATRSTTTGLFEHAFPLPTGTILPNGKPIEWQIISIFRFNEDGLIVEEWAQADTANFLSQLGAPANDTL
jgi:hypothetical protein